MKAQPFATIYENLLGQIFENEYEAEINARTGVRISMLEGGYSFKLDLSNGKLPVPGNRRYWPRIAAAEVAWQFMGTQDPTWILKNAPKIWQDFVEDGKIKTAYGYRWKHHFGRDQLLDAIHELSFNRTNRQLYVSAWDPATDGLGAANQPKNIPCPVGFSVNRVRGKIHMSVFIRSSDVFVGLPYDVMGYALTLDAIATSVGQGCVPGTLHFTLAHAHIYEPHWEFLRECVSCTSVRSEWTKNVEPSLPVWSVDSIVRSPEDYIKQVKNLSNRVNQSDWSPLPEVVL